jgi:hypothetical protein
MKSKFDGVDIHVADETSCRLYTVCIILRGSQRIRTHMAAKPHNRGNCLIGSASRFVPKPSFLLELYPTSSCTEL